MSLHHSYLIILSALFSVVFAIMIHSLARHRRAGDPAAARFSGPTGTGQWLWAMVPIAILVSVDLALIDAADERRPLAAPTISLAAAPTPAAPVPAASGTPKR